MAVASVVAVPTVRIRMLYDVSIGPPLEEYIHGDVAEVSAERAQEWIASGWAEATSEPCGRAWDEMGVLTEFVCR